MAPTIEQAQADIARKEHERLAQRVKDAPGQPGITTLRVKVKDALHTRMAAELKAARAGRQVAAE